MPGMSLRLTDELWDRFTERIREAGATREGWLRTLLERELDDPHHMPTNIKKERPDGE